METPNLSLPYLLPSQAQKHVTHNEALRGLDALAQIAVVSRTLTSPSADALEGERFIPAAASLGEWTGRDGLLACREDGGWTFRAPRAGWLAYVMDEASFVVHDGEAWTELATAADSPQHVVRLGINTAADDINRLALKSDASLFDNDGDDNRIKVNKAARSDTASLLFLPGYGGRAEMGRTGSDSFTVKVSANCATWHEALSVAPPTGELTTGGPRLRATSSPISCPTAAASAAIRSSPAFAFEAPTYVDTRKNPLTLA